MLNRTAEHALRAVIFLARQPDYGPVSAEVVADALKTPPNYLAKTLGALAVAGIVKGRRGPGGGYRLLVDPADLTIARVVDLFEPEHGMTSCLLGGRPCSRTDPCEAHYRWAAVRDASREPLRRTTVAELLGESVGPDPALAVQPSAVRHAADDGLLRILYLV